MRYNCERFLKEKSKRPERLGIRLANGACLFLLNHFRRRMPEEISRLCRIFPNRPVHACAGVPQAILRPFFPSQRSCQFSALSLDHFFAKIVPLLGQVPPQCRQDRHKARPRTSHACNRSLFFVRLNNRFTSATVNARKNNMPLISSHCSPAKCYAWLLPDCCVRCGLNGIFSHRSNFQTILAS